MKGCTSLPESSQSLDVEGTHKSNFDNQALRVCFISHQYPPGMVGGIGRFTADLAAGFAANGHDVHVLTSHGGVSGVSVEDGVWLHRLVSQPVVPKEIVHEAAGLFLTRMFMVYREVLRLHGEKPFDIISDPIWLAEGLAVALEFHGSLQYFPYIRRQKPVWRCLQPIALRPGIHCQSSRCTP